MVPDVEKLDISCAVEGYPAAFTTIEPPSKIVYKQLLCTLSNLSPGTHTIVLTNLRSGDYLRVDYFEVTPPPVVTTTPTAAGPITQTSTTSTTSTSHIPSQGTQTTTIGGRITVVVPPPTTTSSGTGSTLGDINSPSSSGSSGKFSLNPDVT